jgi:hypothetical protein
VDGTGEGIAARNAGRNYNHPREMKAHREEMEANP